MAVLPITVYGDKILRKKATKVTEVDLKTIELIKNMFDTMRNANGIGLAANQVGSDKSIFVVDISQVEDYEDTKPIALINPKIINRSEKKILMEEGCLSIPDVREEVRRPESITIVYHDTDLKEHTMEADGLMARVMQHEYDHLQGILFTDLLPDDVKKRYKRDINKIRKRKVEIDYPITEDTDYQLHENNFHGHSRFCSSLLKRLFESRHKVVAVVTTPDKEKGRGQKVSFTPVKEFAVANNIPVLQPEKLKDENFISDLKKFNADLFVIVAFRILPKEVFTIPSKGSFNLHGSLLPKYRGAAPIQWALIKGEKETGLTTFALAEKVDTGNIYYQEKIEIEDEDNFGTLHHKMSELGAEVVLKTVEIIESGNFTLKEQDNSKASPAPKITKEIQQIDWNNSAEEIHNLIRGLSPYPGAFFHFSDKLIKIYSTKLSKEKLSPSEIKQTKTELFIGCGEDSLQILELQQEGKRRMHTEEFLRGFSFK